MPKKISKQNEDNDGMKVLNIIRTSTKKKEKMYKKVTDDIRSIKETQKKIDQRFEKTDQRFEKIDQRFEKIDQRFEKIDQRFDRVDSQIADIKLEFVKFEERMENVISNSANKLYTRIDPLLKELEDKRLDRELSTQKSREIEMRIEKLEKAAN